MPDDHFFSGYWEPVDAETPMQFVPGLEVSPRRNRQGGLEEALRDERFGDVYRELLDEREHLLHGICDALDPGTPTESILRALLHGTEHEGHR